MQFVNQCQRESNFVQLLLQAKTTQNINWSFIIYKSQFVIRKKYAKMNAKPEQELDECEH